MLRRFSFALLSLCFGGTVHAGIVLSFSPDGSPVNFLDSVGSAIEIPLFVNQTIPLALGEPDLTIDGLAGFGFIGTVDPAFGQITNFTFAPPYIALNFPVFPSSSEVIAGGNLNFPSPTGRSIQLGTFTVQATSPGDFVLTITDDPIFDDFVTDSFTTIDTVIFPTSSTSYSAIITAVPEPSSMLLVGVIAGACVIRRRPRQPITCAGRDS
ncbi:MAG: PEP-CTERM sorting domain-containing protein [Planctomycetota bacterium]